MYIQETIEVTIKLSDNNNILHIDKEHFITTISLGIDTETKKVSVKYPDFNEEDYYNFGIFNDDKPGLFAYDVFQRLHDLKIINYMMEDMCKISDKIEEDLYDNAQSKIRQYINTLTFEQVNSLISNIKKINIV